MIVDKITKLGMVGTGTMGSGIAQIASLAGIEVYLFDSQPNGAQKAKEGLAKIFAHLIDRGRLTLEASEGALSHLHVTSSLKELADCDLVIEAIIENIDIKRDLLVELEGIIRPEAIIATNTSSFSVSGIASKTKYPNRVAGYHFFNPVPLMRLVEVIPGLRTDPKVCDLLYQLGEKMGHTAVRAKDTPGFIVNHAGRAYGSEALTILKESVAEIGQIDRILRLSAGFRLGPFELMDLVGLDVSLPAMESIYQQYYQEPRYRPNPILRLMLDAKLLGRKTDQGFYKYKDGKMLNPYEAPVIPNVTNIPKIWLGTDNEEDHQRLTDLVTKLGGAIDSGEKPAADSLCLIAPWGFDATTASQKFKVDAKQVIAIDLLDNFEKHRTLMVTPVTHQSIRDAAYVLFSKDGVDVTIINDSPGFVLQRVLASIVNLGCDVAQQGVASVEDIDRAVVIGLNYPMGPLTWGDQLGAKRIETILDRMVETTGDARYRPSLWLRRRVTLDLSLHHKESIN